MDSYLITAKDKKKREKFVKEYSVKHNINQLDITIIEKEPDSKTTSQSIGIETVKLIQKKLYFKPIKSTNKLIVIEDAQLLTPEAQNALLKVLEEPPANTFIILGSESKEMLLPTILSRCQIIELVEEHKKISEKTMDELQVFIQNLPTSSIGEKLKLAEQLAKNKDKAIDWLENLILIIREKLLHNYSTDTFDTGKPIVLVYTLKKLQYLHTLLKTTNVNPRIAIEHTLLSL